MEPARSNALGAARGWRSSSSAAGDTEISSLLCRAGDVHCALPISNVVETMRSLPIDTLSGSGKFVRGASIIRGTPVPVIDLNLMTGSAPADEPRFVIAGAGGRTFAIAVDEVIGIRKLPAEPGTDLPPILNAVSAEAVTGIVVQDEALVLLLEAGRLVDEEVFHQLNSAVSGGHE